MDEEKLKKWLERILWVEIDWIKLEKIKELMDKLWRYEEN